jgi:geranylgeranyl pyrophosphate synthase
VREYFDIIEGKTAALFEACGECGALLSGQDEGGVRQGAALGRDFGIAFQIVDDLLDFGVGAKALGKGVFSDAKNGFSTLPLILFFSECSPADRASMHALLRDVQDEAKQARIRALLDEYAVVSKARDMAAERVAAGLPFLESLPDSPAARHLRDLCSLMTERTV